MSAPNECKPVVCPGCGSHEIQWWEDVPVTRAVIGLGASGRVVVVDCLDYPVWEGGKNERLECNRCGHEWHHEAGYSYGVGDEE